MKFLLLYFLAGAIVAVWTAINQLQIDSVSGQSQKNNNFAYLTAYILIAMAWPVSVAVSIYSIVQTIFLRELQ